MMHHKLLPVLERVTLFLCVALAFCRLDAANNGIGMAIANGSFQIDQASVRGNSTLFEGSIIQTSTATAQLRLDRGAEIRLAPDTRVRVFGAKLLLESGYAELRPSKDFDVEAQSLHILSKEPGTWMRIRLGGEHRVTVAAVHGIAMVTNAAGDVVANLEAGRSLDFETQEAGAAAPTRASGCLLRKSGKLVLADQMTSVVLEVEGAALEAEVGNRLEITGLPESTKPSVSGASQLIKVAAVKRLAQGGCSAVARKIGASAAGAAAAGAATGASAAGAAAGAAGAAGAAAGAAAGIGVGTVAVIGGVAAAATVGGLAAVGSLPGQGETPSQASR
jgi:hypothetical protein